MKASLPLSVVLLAELSRSSIPQAGAAPPTSHYVDVQKWGMSPSATPARNSAALAKIFASSVPSTFYIPAGTYMLSCGGSNVAQSAISLIGAGVARSVLKFEHPCRFDHAVMRWQSKSAVHLSGFTIDLNGSHFSHVQSVLSFEAYAGSANGLRVDHIAIVNGTSPALQIEVAATDGFTYSSVTIDHNRLQMRPAPSQNQCIALSTVNNSGNIPSAQITNNICRGSGIQADGKGTVVAYNDVSGYEFGTGIFTGFVTRSNVNGARWSNNVATLHFAQPAPHFIAGETIYVWEVVPSGYNGTFKINHADPSSVSYSLLTNPGNYVRAGFVSPQPSSQKCVIRSNFIHDTAQTLDVNRTAPGGLENNCISSVVENNRAQNLGGAGFFNFADGATYLRNRAVAVGYSGAGSAGGDGDRAAFVLFNNDSGIKGYASAGVVLQENESKSKVSRPRFGYYEEPWHHFNPTLRGNSFNAAERSMVRSGQ